MSNTTLIFLSWYWFARWLHSDLLIVNAIFLLMTYQYKFYSWYWMLTSHTMLCVYFMLQYLTSFSIFLPGSLMCSKSSKSKNSALIFFSQTWFCNIPPLLNEWQFDLFCHSNKSCKVILDKSLFLIPPPIHGSLHVCIGTVTSNIFQDY